ncbi:MAG: hypothetical protein EA391_02785 [Balneolaceae bacterium]|nr:MAG: hypothetical protein EA391_02785 [Balneolaceae bacterium]
MSEPSFHKITPRAIRVWQIGNFIGNLFFFGIPAAYAAVFGWSGFHFWILSISVTFIFIAWMLSIFLTPYLTWKNWRYAINEKEIELKHGVLIKTHTLIPLSRVQHVDTRQGPLLRWYNLSTVTISTAATTHEIPGLDTQLADRVRREISTYARLAEDDV